MGVSWLLFKKSAKQSAGRLTLTAAAIALGVLMILSFASAVNGLNARTVHGSWYGGLFNQPEIPGVDPLLVEYVATGNLYRWQNKSISTLSVRATGETSPKINDMPNPKEGEYYVSSALEKIIQQNPESHVGDRFGSTKLGVIDDSLTKSPDELLAIRGMSEAEASATNTSKAYTYFEKTNLSTFDGTVGFILLFGGTILLLPIVMFIAIATQLGSSQREKRYAAMRLIGATKAQVTRIIALESFMATLAGVLVGTIVYLIVRQPMSTLSFDGMRFWPQDLSVDAVAYSLIVALTIALSLFANWWGMRHTRTSPLGVTKSQKLNKKPRAWHTIPLFLGLLIFAWFASPMGDTWLKTTVAESSAPLLMMFTGIILVMFGLLWAGPWLTAAIARQFAKRTGSAQTLLATKRIEGHAKQVFRSVGGVVLALFAGSFYLTAVSGIDKLDARSISSNGYSQIKSDAALAIATSLPESFQENLNKQSYVVSSAAIYQSDKGHLVQCADLTTYTDRSCPDGAAKTDYVQINFEASSDQEITLTAAPTNGTPKDFLVALDSNESIDALRSFVAVQLRNGGGPGYVVSGTYSHVAVSDPIIKELAALAYAGMAVTLFVAIASLVVSTIGGLLERQRSLLTLRLSGMTIRQMKGVVMVESLVPLVAVSLLAAGIGVWIGAIFITALSNSVRPEVSPLYMGIVGGALAIAALAIYLILPVLRRLTSFEENRTE